MARLSQLAGNQRVILTPTVTCDTSLARAPCSSASLTICLSSDFPSYLFDYKDKTMMPGFIMRRHGIFVPGIVRQHHSTLHLLSGQTKDGLVCRGGNGGRAHKHEKLNPGCGSATFAPVAAVKHEYTSAVHIHKRF